MNEVKYILGMPIQIEKIGLLYPLTVEDFVKYYDFFTIIHITKNTVLQQIDMNNKEYRREIEENVKNFDILFQNTEFVQMLIGLLAVCFRTENIKLNLYNKSISVNDRKVDRDNWDEIREAIIKINKLNVPKQAKTKELQEWYDKARKSQGNNSGITLEDMIDSIMLQCGFTSKQIREMTFYQLNRLFGRLVKKNNFEINIQMICYSDKIDLDYWCGHIEDHEEKLSSSLGSTKNTLNNVMKN